MSFTDQKPRIATEEDIKAPWSGHKDGSRFYCGLCGHLFKVGDYWRWVYAGKIHSTNFFVCKDCDGDNILQKRMDLIDEWEQLSNGKFRFIANQMRSMESELGRNY